MGSRRAAPELGAAEWLAGCGLSAPQGALPRHRWGRLLQLDSDSGGGGAEQKGARCRRTQRKTSFLPSASEEVTWGQGPTPGRVSTWSAQGGGSGEVQSETRLSLGLPGPPPVGCTGGLLLHLCPGLSSALHIQLRHPGCSAQHLMPLGLSSGSPLPAPSSHAGGGGETWGWPGIGLGEAAPGMPEVRASVLQKGQL